VEDWGGAVLRSAGGETLVWAPFPAGTEYFGRADQRAMVNYRVGDLDAMLAQQRAAGVAVEGPMEHENGRFGWATDPEGSRFERWQPKPGD
jgi:predicted enzyme related to lactoylglutathione lyase